MEPKGEPPNDVVVGSRYVSGGGVTGWPFYRRWMSRGVNAYSRWLLGLPLRDCSGSYRCYRTAKLKELEIGELRSRGYSIYEELLWQLHRRGARIDEIPIVFVDRRYGQTKINSSEACRAVGILLGIAVRDRVGRKRTRRATVGASAMGQRVNDAEVVREFAGR
jgi:dolichol-phosphate mannosyltransferase